MAQKPKHEEGKKQKHYCNKFSKDFNNGPHQKIFKKRKKMEEEVSKYKAIESQVSNFTL